MASVPLRVYSREIENLVESGHLDEAIAHCQHILKTYPMHMETYRLLGKAFLESRRYTDAADIFQRSLMAVPDDFVSHVGMSIIRDDEGKLDDSIWHMERAFEVQPSNPAIQGELRRLYGRRDGVEPPKIRLSRDALANMYSQGELFNQAIAEIRSVLAEDPNRPDLQIMLARAYYRAGHKVEAAEMAAVLLKKYPYCQDALRILLDVIPASANPENLQVYRQRLAAIDPYAAFASGSMFATDQVADTAVMLEQLESGSGNLPKAEQPNWASSLGIRLEGEKQAEAAPGWLSEVGPASEAEGNAAAAVQATAPPTEEPIPDWMRTVGWQEASGNAPETPVSFDAEGPAEPAEPIAQAEIPDWLKSMAPPQADEPSALEEAEMPEDSGKEGELPEWLRPAGAAALTGLSAEPGQERTAADPGQAIPDWLQGGNVEPVRTAEESRPPVRTQSLAEEDVKAPAASEPVAGEASALPDWLNGLASADASTGTDQPAAGLDLPGSLPFQAAGSGPEQSTVPAQDTGGASLDGETRFQPAPDSKPLDIGDDALSWLESLAAKQGAKPEELLTSADERSDSMPDWLRDIRQTPDVGGLGPTADELMETAIQQQAAAGEDQDDSASWLEKLGADQAPDRQPAAASGGPSDSDLPDWMRPGGEQPSAGSSSTQESVTPPLQERAAATPVTKSLAGSTPEPALEPPAAQDDITITSWLSKKDVARELESRGLGPAAAAGPQEQLPEWLQDMEKPAAERAVQEPALGAQPAGDIPEWLRQAEQSGTPGDGEGQAAAAGGEAGSWLDEAAPVPQPPAATSPEEWLPIDRQESGPVTTSGVPATTPSLQAERQPIPSEGDRPAPPASRPAGQEKDAGLLEEAQHALAENRLEEAMGLYAKLIKKGKFLEEVIHNLRDAIYRHPVDVVICQTLGDAYMRANRLQDALDAYSKAEDLLR